MNQPFFTPADVIAIAGFVFVVIGAMAWRTYRLAMTQSPRARMRVRLQTTVAQAVPSGAPETAADGSLRLKQAHPASESVVIQLWNRLRAEAEHVGGPAGVRWIAAGAIVGLALGVALVFLSQLTAWLYPLVPLPLAAAAAWAAHRMQVARYRNRFLAVFPDALDLIIRAVRAGVPVVQAIITAGRELPDPVGREFRIMGDALRLGLDQQEVMEAASNRIGLADFKFFMVCLQLQRETGGPLAETLDNLAGIIRARRELKLKTRALTAEGRTAAKIIAVIPFSVMGAMQVTSPDYMAPLFNTEPGRHLLTLAVGMVVVGLLVIARMARLED